MAARKDQECFWVGMSDAEIAEYYARQDKAFYSAQSNFTNPHYLYDDAQLDLTYTAPGQHDVLDTLTSADLDVDKAVAAVAADALLAAVAAYDAADKRRKLADTARGVMLAKWDANTGRPCMTDLAKVLGVKRPTAIGRFRKLCEVAPALAWDVNASAAFKAVKVDAAHEAALRESALRSGTVEGPDKVPPMFDIRNDVHVRPLTKEENAEVTARENAEARIDLEASR